MGNKSGEIFSRETATLMQHSNTRQGKLFDSSRGGGGEEIINVSGCYESVHKNRAGGQRAQKVETI